MRDSSLALLGWLVLAGCEGAGTNKGEDGLGLTLPDEDGDGIVLTSLHSRPTTRVYVKAVRRGVADAPLSGEEERALRDAGVTT